MAEKDVSSDLSVTLREQFKKHLDVVGKKFNAHVKLDNDDEVVVLKSHLVVEYYLNHLLVLFDEDGYGKSKKSTFAEKVSEIEKNPRILKDLKPMVMPAIKTLNKIRNELGHELEFKLTESQVDSIGFCFGEKYILAKFNGEEKSLKAEFINLMKFLIKELYRPIAYKVVKGKIKK